MIDVNEYEMKLSKPNATQLNATLKQLALELDIVVKCTPPHPTLVRTWPLEHIPRVSTGEASGAGFEKVKVYFLKLVIATAIFFQKIEHPHVFFAT